MWPHPSLAASPSLLFVLILLLATALSAAFHIIDRPANYAAQPTNSKRCWSTTTDPRAGVSLKRCNKHQLHTILKTGLTSTISSSSMSDAAPLLPDSTKGAIHQKSILLTGASRGLGKSLALALSTCHPSLLILSGRDEVALLEVKQECIQFAKANSNVSSIADASSMKVEIVACDLADKTSVEALASRSLQLAQKSSTGIIDVLINNGGISSRSSFLETKLDVDEKLMQVNFFSGVALAKRLVPGMVDKKDGMVIWISSVQGKLGTPYRTSYAASKFAIQGYCEALRSELASSNVSVHVVSPGYIRTNLSLSAVMGDGKAYNKMDETTANGADPDEVARIILKSIAAGKSDFVVAATLSSKVALWLKFFAPSLLESMLVKRYEKQSKIKLKQK